MLKMVDQITSLYASFKNNTDDKSIDTCTAIKDTLHQMALVVKKDRNAALIPEKMQQEFANAREQINDAYTDMEPGQQAFVQTEVQRIIETRDETIDKLAKDKAQAESPEGSTIEVTDGVNTKTVNAFNLVNTLNDIALNNAHNITDEAYNNASFDDIGSALGLPSTHRDEINGDFKTIDGQAINVSNGSAKNYMHELISQLQNTTAQDFVNDLARYSTKERSQQLLYNTGADLEQMKVASEEIHASIV